MANLNDYIANDLLTVTGGKMLDARQGKVLAELIDNSKLKGSFYALVKGGKTASQNFAELQAAYNDAKLLRNRYVGGCYYGEGAFMGSSFTIGDVISMYDGNDDAFWFEAATNIDYYQEDPYEGSPDWTFLPNGYDTSMILSSANKFTLLVAPGNYKTSILTIDTDYINIISLSGNMDVAVSGLNITANDLFLKGIDCGSGKFGIGSNLNLLVCENCKGTGDYSFGNTGSVVSGKFIDCFGGYFSFGGNIGTASGTFIRCSATGSAFGCNGTASGVFTDCFCYNRGFGAGTGNVGIASGTFIRCTALSSWSFGGILASGKFYDCISSSQSFAGQGSGTASGEFYNCRSNGPWSFGGCYGTVAGTFSGKAVNCISGIASFGNSIMSGILINCIMNDMGSGFTGDRKTYILGSTYLGFPPGTVLSQIGFTPTIEVTPRGLVSLGTVLILSGGGTITFNGTFTAGQTFLLANGTTPITVSARTGQILNCIDYENNVINQK